MDQTQPNKRQQLLKVLMLFQGGCGLAYEYTFSVVASTLLGNSIQQWAIIIALMLFAMGLGAEIQKHFQTKHLAEALVGSQLLLALAGGLGPVALIWIFSFSPTHFALIHYGTAVFVGLLIGFELPLIIRMNEEFTKEVRLNLAAILRMDYIGALAGALLWVFLLLRWFEITQIALILGLFTAIGSSVCLSAYRQYMRHPAGWAVASISMVVLLSWSLVHVKTWTLHAEQALFVDRVIYAESTPYQHIVLTEGSSGRISCYINGKLQFASTDEFIYHENLVHPAMRIAPRRERILILGGGDGLALREVLKYPSVVEVELVDIDPAMTQLAKDHPVFRTLNQDSLNAARLSYTPNGTKDAGGYEKIEVASRLTRFSEVDTKEVELRVLNLDAANYVRQSSGLFDIIILDFPDPSSPDLAKLYSTAFYRALAHKLHPQGIVVQQATSPIHAREAFLSIGRTMQASGFAAVPYHDNVPSFGEWGWWVAGPSEDWSAETLAERMRIQKPIEVPVRYLTPELQAASLHFGRDQLKASTDAITTQTSLYVFHAYLNGWR